MVHPQGDIVALVEHTTKLVPFEKWEQHGADWVCCQRLKKKPKKKPKVVGISSGYDEALLTEDKPEPLDGQLHGISCVPLVRGSAKPK